MARSLMTISKNTNGDALIKVQVKIIDPECYQPSKNSSISL